MFKKLLRKLKKKRAVQVDPRRQLADRYPDLDPETLEVIDRVTPFTMTSPERINAVCDSVRYMVRNSIPGDVVECGVWRGGSMMSVALTLMQLEDTRPTLHLYDTFAGMPPAGEIDRDFLDQSAEEQLDSQDREDPQSIWCYSGIEEVRTNLNSTGYPGSQLRFVQGKVEETLRDDLPEQIALLRLDTDWYESTRVCLEQLYPRLVPGGILIIDDYGHWKGCRTAVDEYFQQATPGLFLQRIDYTGRIAVKPWESAESAGRAILEKSA